MAKQSERREIPFRVTFRHMEPREDVRMLIQERIEKLEDMNTRAVECEVVVSIPYRKNSTTPDYDVTIRFHIPGEDIFINRNTEKDEPVNRDVLLSVGEAFDLLERRLEDSIRVRRGKVKTHVPEAEARVISIFDFDGYGFLQTPDGREIYFDKNSIVNEKFENLRVGQKVVFNEEMGVKGPQVTSMRVI